MVALNKWSVEDREFSCFGGFFFFGRGSVFCFGCLGFGFFWLAGLLWVLGVFFGLDFFCVIIMKSEKLLLYIVKIHFY